MIERLLLFPFFTIALVVHELAHALAADHLGDPTPRSLGRISINPLKHLDPIGTLMILFVGIGWAKPVIYDPYNLSKPRRDGGIISLAGPASNLLLAVLLSALIKFFTLPEILGHLLTVTAQINILLAVFNLIPVYPLDGEKILAAILPRDLAYEYQAIMNRYGMIILILMILPIFGTSPIISLISPAIDFLSQLLLG